MTGRASRPTAAAREPRAGPTRRKGRHPSVPAPIHRTHVTDSCLQGACGAAGHALTILVTGGAGGPGSHPSRTRLTRPKGACWRVGSPTESWASRVAIARVVISVERRVLSKRSRKARPKLSACHSGARSSCASGAGNRTARAPLVQRRRRTGRAGWRRHRPSTSKRPHVKRAPR